jgi:molybdate transport system regulatory protein
MTPTRHSRQAALSRLVPKVKVWLEHGGEYAFGLGIAEILQAVERTGSIKQAAADLGKSYRHVWSRIKEAEEAFGRPLVESHVGGSGTRRTSLTPVARRMVARFMALRGRMFQLVQEEFACLFGETDAKPEP